MDRGALRAVFRWRTEEERPTVQTFTRARSVWRQLREEIPRRLGVRLWMKIARVPPRTREEVVAEHRTPGHTVVEATYLPGIRTLRLERVLLDSNQRTTESARRAIEMLREAEKLWAGRIRRIQTVPTILTPRAMGKLGFKPVRSQKLLPGTVLYEYVKKIEKR